MVEYWKRWKTKQSEKYVIFNLHDLSFSVSLFFHLHYWHTIDLLSQYWHQKKLRRTTNIPINIYDHSVSRSSEAKNTGKRGCYHQAELTMMIPNTLNNLHLVQLLG